MGRPGSISLVLMISCFVSLPPSPARGADGSRSWLGPFHALAGAPRTTRKVSSVLQDSAARDACREHTASAEHCPPGALPQPHGPPGRMCPQQGAKRRASPPDAGWPCLAWWGGLTSLLWTLQFSTMILNFLHSGRRSGEAEGDMGNKSPGCPHPFPQLLVRHQQFPPFHTLHSFDTWGKGCSHSGGDNVWTAATPQPRPALWPGKHDVPGVSGGL